ncbi:hypothetical protein SAMN05216272_1058 [Pseudomonas panipatensis]|uniref:Uncharacterized protein n=1 Tax=Pseudomonas panipatensis TaxID=428992 RepID=A0A1G8H4I4_9PSED|nr:hypothetical protein SAMN05216272_1058 [Pseudomonas panipatensis]SMP56459.1 hypothetical protein SAMN06295951_1048 [Pseudomonas panipatensis]
MEMAKLPTITARASESSDTLVVPPARTAGRFLDVLHLINALFALDGPARHQSRSP